MLASVNVRAECHAVIIHPAEARQAEHLEAAAIGEHRSVPRHEPVQSPQLLYYVYSRSEVQMIGVSQNHLETYILEFIGRYGFYRSLAAHGQKDRRGHSAVTGIQLSSAGAGQGTGMN